LRRIRFSFCTSKYLFMVVLGFTFFPYCK
jgi:hypothetical protein